MSTVATRKAMGAEDTELRRYREASRETMEPFIELVARIERAADLEPGTFLEMALGWLNWDGADEIVGQIEGGYQLKNAPPDWENQVRAILAEARR